MTRSVFEARMTGINRRGRPRKTWKDAVREEVEKRGVNWEDVKKIAIDRMEWRKRCKARVE